MSENTDEGAHGLTEAQLSKILHDWRNKETTKQSVREITERTICDFAGVPYDPVDRSHRAVMQKRWEAVVRLQGEQIEEDRHREARKQLRGAALSSAWDKFISIVTGMVVLLGLGWLAGKLGIKLPGVG